MKTSPSSRRPARRLVLTVSCVLLLGVAAGLGTLKWRGYARDRREGRAVESVRALTDAGRWAEAGSLSQQQHGALGRLASLVHAGAWRALDFKIAGALRDLPRLVALAESDPSLLTLDETSALWLYRTYDAAGMAAPAEALRAAWKGQEISAVLWLCADADRLIATNHIEDARKLLKSRSFTGVEDVGRLLRLAMVSADRPAELAGYLAQAYSLDPKNPDLRSMRGQLLERAGQPEYARIEYIAALAADPKNPLQRDQLGKFYLRQRDLSQAAQVFSEKLGDEAPDFVWERAAFLARLLGRPGPAVSALSATRRSSYAAWLASLPSDQLWDGAGYAALHLSPDHELNRPSAFWLGLVEHLRNGDEAWARQHLEQTGRAVIAEAPALHASLRLALAVRGGATVAKAGIRFPAPFENEHQFAQETRAVLAGQAKTEAGAELTRVLRSKNGLSACFLAEGWLAPAIALADWDAATTAPEWLQFGLVQALREVRGLEAALAFARRLPAQPATDLARAELLLVHPHEAEGLALLEKLSRGRGDPAYRAGWLRATRLVELKRYEDALATIEGCVELRATVPAGELRARIALLRGDRAGAEKQYRALREQSLEAGAFMARQAFAAHDWREARRLTTLWLDKFPDNLQLRRNLTAIGEQEKQP